MPVSLRLDPAEEAELDRLAVLFGGRSEALREALRRLAAEERRRAAFRGFVAEWGAEHGGAPQDEIDAEIRRLGL
jgi:Arc/MetJ-type ribon-helix-helix transcriptional regulator